MLFTICTPTYNRAHLLSRLHTSLLNNADEHCKIEWLVIDDGSSDNTEDLVRSFCENAALRIRYIKKENQGKHSCLNIGFKEANGELFHILDSDDMLAEGSLKIVREIWNKIKLDRKYAGVIGICNNMNSMKPLGACFPAVPMDAKVLEIRHRFNIDVDHADYIRTDLLRDKNYPIYESERFVPEILVMCELDIAHTYYCINQPLKLVEYQDTGITKNYVKLASSNPQGTITALTKVIKNNDLMKIMGFKGRLRYITNYIRYWLHAKNKTKLIIPSLRFLIETVISIPLGILFYFKDNV